MSRFVALCLGTLVLLAPLPATAMMKQNPLELSLEFVATVPELLVFESFAINEVSVRRVRATARHRMLTPEISFEIFPGKGVRSAFKTVPPTYEKMLDLVQGARERTLLARIVVRF